MNWEELRDKIHDGSIKVVVIDQPSTRYLVLKGSLKITTECRFCDMEAAAKKEEPPTIVVPVAELEPIKSKKARKHPEDVTGIYGRKKKR